MINKLPKAWEPMVDTAAMAIYSHWQFQPYNDGQYVPWVNGGNSLKQDEARTYARVRLLAVLNAALETGVARESNVEPSKRNTKGSRRIILNMGD